MTPKQIRTELERRGAVVRFLAFAWLTLTWPPAWVLLELSLLTRRHAVARTVLLGMGRDLVGMRHAALAWALRGGRS